MRRGRAPRLDRSAGCRARGFGPEHRRVQVLVRRRRKARPAKQRRRQARARRAGAFEPGAWEAERGRRRL